MWLTLLLWNRLELKAGNTDNPLLQLVNSRTRTGNREQSQTRTDSVSGTTSRSKRLGTRNWNGNWRVSDLPGQMSNWNWRSDLRANRAKKREEEMSRTCRAGPGQKSNWNWRRRRVCHIGLLKYPGGLVISPYFTTLFFSNSPPFDIF